MSAIYASKYWANKNSRAMMIFHLGHEAMMTPPGKKMVALDGRCDFGVPVLRNVELLWGR